MSSVSQLVNPFPQPAVTGFLRLCVFSLGLACGASALAQEVVGAGDSGAPDAREIVRRVNAVSTVDQLTRKILFRTTDKRGRVRERQTVSFRRHFDDERRLALFFTAPSNIRDTAVLTLDYPDTTEDDQWLYLPALRKVRRVPAADRGDFFLGTDFSFEDMKLDGSLSTDDYDYSLAPDAGPDNYRLVATPKTEKIAKELGYSRNDIRVDAQTLVVMEVVFWGLGGEKFKTLSVSDVRSISGTLTRHYVRMQNHKTGHSTELIVSDVDYASTIDASVFTQQSLKRGV
ncbi:MAG: outer membrane lipoprotein-sorting protein [Congregibacter sp.]